MLRRRAERLERECAHDVPRPRRVCVRLDDYDLARKCVCLQPGEEDDDPGAADEEPRAIEWGDGEDTREPAAVVICSMCDLAWHAKE